MPWRWMCQMHIKQVQGRLDNTNNANRRAIKVGVAANVYGIATHNFTTRTTTEAPDRLYTYM